MIGEDCGRWDGRIFSNHAITKPQGTPGGSVVGARAILDS